MGQGVNYVTGDYSRGASGFWVENGKIQYPVEEITVASTLQEMFQHIVAIGADTIVRGTKETGSVLIETDDDRRAVSESSRPGDAEKARNG